MSQHSSARHDPIERLQSRHWTTVHRRKWVTVHTTRAQAGWQMRILLAIDGSRPGRPPSTRFARRPWPANYGSDRRRDTAVHPARDEFVLVRHAR